MLIRQVPEIGEAFEILKVVSRNKKTRRDYEIREKALKDRASSESWHREQGIEQGIEQGVEQGIEQGIEQGDQDRKMKTARRMLAKGYSMDEVLDLTEISKEALAKVQEKA